jgi:alpha-L-rhamnosidase
MKTLFYLLVLSNWAVVFAQPSLGINHLKCEDRTNPLGITSFQPFLSWQITSEKRNITQLAYRIIVSNDSMQLAADTGTMWDSKKVTSNQSIMISYAGKPLLASVKYYWKVMIWDGSGMPSAWSEPAIWQMALLKPDDWGKARWIGMEDLPESMRVVPGIHGNGDNLGHKALQRPIIPLLRKEFEVKYEVASATLFISGLGQYEAYINGTKIGNSFLSPGWTEYDKTVLYNSYDITSSLKPGANALGAIVGNGFYNINRERYRKLVIAYGSPKLICKLRIIYTNGSTEDIDSGDDWKASPSPVTFTSIYSGEDYDARLERPKWNMAGIDETCWGNAQIVSAPKGILKPETDYPITLKSTVAAKNIYKLADGKYLYDFGQNASGIVELKVKGKKGQVVRLVPAELITKDKEVNQNATGRWYYYSYTLKGDGIEVWHPQFTFYGFRYVQVEGAVPDTAKATDGLVQMLDLKFLHNCNSSPSNGTFQCSNELFNRIKPLIDWAIRSNLQSVLSDCPHREKLGWLEQSFLMGASVNYNYDIYNLYRKIIQDMMDAQTADGLIPDITPEYVHFEGGFRDSPEWGSASIILPYLLYKWYGDTKVMETAWPMMTKYVEYLSEKAQNNILSHGLGDWYDMGPQRPGFAQLTPTGITATSIYYYDLNLLSEMAGMLRKSTEKNRYSKWAEEVRTAFNAKFFNPATCIYSTGSQTAMSMPLCLGLVDTKYRAKVVANLVDSINKNGKALTAGDIGFHYLVEALTSNGQSELLYEMNNRDDVPGYGFQLKKGATALTESWQALEVVSNNHLMLGHVMEWFYNGIGGIRQDDNSVAFKNCVIKPSVVGNLTSAQTTFESPYGTIATDWKKDNTSFSLKVTIPCNTSAQVYVPVNKGQSVQEGTIPVTQVKDIQFIRNEVGYSVYQVGSGNYQFVVK